MSEWYDKEGEPIEMMEWARLLEDYEYKVVGRTDLPEGLRVSTVWLGLDHGFGGVRLIFETMVFGADGEALAEGFARYSTQEEARMGHEQTVANLSVKQ